MPIEELRGDIDDALEALGWTRPTASWRGRWRRWLDLVFTLRATLAYALDPSRTPTPVTGNATWFYALGSPYGGCGLPQVNLDAVDAYGRTMRSAPK